MREKTVTDSSLSGCFSLSLRARAVLCLRDVQSPDVRLRVSVCVCLHRIWCSRSRRCLLSRSSVGSFSVRGAVRRHVS